MTGTKIDRKPWWRSSYALAAASAVVFLGAVFIFFQTRKTSAPAIDKIIRRKIITQAVDRTTQNVRFADNRSSAARGPASPMPRGDENKNTVKKEGGFVSVNRLVPKKMFSYNPSVSKLAVVRRTTADMSAASSRFDLDAIKEKSDYNRVVGVTAKEVKNKFTFVLLADKAIAGHKSFFLEQPPRFVIDVPGQWNFPQESELKLKGKMAKSVRFGKHPDFIRIVIDLTSLAFQAPTVDTSSTGLFVTLTKR